MKDITVPVLLLGFFELTKQVIQNSLFQRQIINVAHKITAFS
jgi:hypothetical protein